MSEKYLGNHIKNQEDFLGICVLAYYFLILKIYKKKSPKVQVL